ncbi:MAG TPA: hypothetical protein O0X50_03425 [Methanocorpusculum sp.]|nr:hypothetical protein [Methanocorpusculum sp.]
MPAALCQAPRRRPYRQPFASEEEREASELSCKQRNAFLSKFRATFGRVLIERNQIERDRENACYRITEAGENMLYLKGLTGKVNFVDGELVCSAK